MAAWDNVFDADDTRDDEELVAPRLVARWPAQPAAGGDAGCPLVVSLLVGDLVAAPAAAICTSTNPRLSLFAGTGGAVVRRGGWEVKRQAEALVERNRRQTGNPGMDAGSVHTTTAGCLPHQVVIHCVASDAGHLSSPEIVRRCVAGALAVAGAAGCASVAMPVFGSGHASLTLEQALEPMARAFRVGSTSPCGVTEVMVITPDPAKAERARRVLDAVLGPASLGRRE
jgi:O-acetyl-ADP-ribose deacetylase (regulator of RNase III)